MNMFYIIPPKGLTRLSVLEVDIRTRYIFLFQLNNLGDNNEKIINYIKSSYIACNIDGLIEYSRRDCAAHFIFRLACLSDGLMQQFWIKCEKKLLLYRLRSGGNLLLYKSIIRLNNDLMTFSSLHQFKGNKKQIFDDILDIIQKLNESQSMLTCDNRTYCNHFLFAPWIIAREFVENRIVVIKNGQVIIPCKYLINFLVLLFEELLLVGIAHMKQFNVTINDSRINNLLMRIRSYFYNRDSNMVSVKHSMISDHSSVEKEIINLPLCMQHLQRNLMSQHRLRHHQRFRYSLFLKDIGLPLEENILFWKKYYSRQNLCSSDGCSHTWDGQSARRFEYSIRHMYGIEGKRKDYKAYSCAALQEMRPQPQEKGGCPFKHLDEVNLRKTLSQSTFLWPEQTEAIIKVAKQNDSPSLPCAYYLSALLHQHRHKRKFCRIPSSVISSHYETKPKKIMINKIKSLDSHSVVKSGSYSTSSNCLDSHSVVKSGSYSTSSNCLDSHSVVKSGSYSTSSNCVDCNYNSIPPEMSFRSPVDYFRLTRKRFS